jgi:hypothetical protein
MARWTRLLAVIALPLALEACAVVPGPGYPPDYDVGAGYYAPYGGYYGGFGDGFLVGPYGDFGHPYGGFRGNHAFRGPVGFHGGVPSIPGARRGGFRGGLRGGGFHGGGRGGGGRGR